MTRMNYIWALGQVLLCLGILIAGTYFLVKKMSNKQFNKSSQYSLMQVVDGMNIGVNQKLLLAKVGEEYVVIMTGNQGQMLKLDERTFKDPKESFQDMFESENPTYTLKNTMKTIKGRLTKK